MGQKNYTLSLNMALIVQNVIHIYEYQIRSDQSLSRVRLFATP